MQTKFCVISFGRKKRLQLSLSRATPPSCCTSAVMKNNVIIFIYPSKTNYRFASDEWYQLGSHSFQSILAARLIYRMRAWDSGLCSSSSARSETTLFQAPKNRSLWKTNLVGDANFYLTQTNTRTSSQEHTHAHPHPHTHSPNHTNTHTQTHTLSLSHSQCLVGFRNLNG